MKTLTITCENHDPLLKVTIRQVPPLMEVHRSLRMAQALVWVVEKLGLQPEEALPEGFEQTVEMHMAQRTWPTCMACLVSSEGFSLTISFEEFCRLPEQFIGEWERAALELNPSWRHVHPVRLRDLMGPPH